MDTAMRTVVAMVVVDRMMVNLLARVVKDMNFIFYKSSESKKFLFPFSRNSKNKI